MSKLFTKTIATIALANAVVLAPHVVVADAATEKIMVVLDSSGSMWGQIDGQSKRDIARSALGELLADLPSEAATGLMVYGHSRQGDCSDIAQLVEPGKGMGQRIKDQVDTIRPLGKTPLTDAVKQAASELSIEDNKATVILLTDGIETCNADPCALAAELESSGVNFTTHVIGFGLSQAEGRQVSCLAELTGGRYLQAANASQLSDAMAVVAQTIEEPAAETPDEGPRPEVSIDSPDSAAIGSSFSVSWTGPESEDDYIDLVPADQEHPYGELSYAYVKDESSAQLRAPAKAGNYKIRYVWQKLSEREVVLEKPIEIVDAEVALVAPETAAIGSSIAVQWKGPDGKGDYIDLVPEQYQLTAGELSYHYTNKGNPASIAIPGEAGAYQLRYVAEGSGGREVLKSVPITVEKVATELAFDPAASQGQQLQVFWKGPGAKGDYVDIVPAGHKQPSGEISYAYIKEKDEPLELALPGKPGEYQVRYILDTAGGRTVLVSNPLTLAAVPVSLDFVDSAAVGQSIKVSWTGPGVEGDYIDIVPRGQLQPRGEITYQYLQEGTSPTQLAMPDTPGDYDLRYIFVAPEGRMVLLVKPITVK